MRRFTKVKIEATVIAPSVPNFLELSDGTWIPLCAVSRTDLQDIKDAWFEDLIERWETQMKDKDKYYEHAEKESKK